MTATLAHAHAHGPTPGASSTRATPTRVPARIPVSRLVAVELRKSFDTRSGLALLAGRAGSALLAMTAVIAFAPRDQLTYDQFTRAIGFPMSIILPIIAVLSVTAEWSQRSGLTTFWLMPHRGRVLVAKAIGVVLVAVASTPIAFGVGAAGNVVGSAIGGVPAQWNLRPADVAEFALGNTLLMLTAFTIGVLIRASSAAIVIYMVYGFVAPTLLAFLAMAQSWFHDLRPWVDAQFSQDALLGGAVSGDQWWHLALTTALWLVLPLTLGTWRLLRAEVK